LGPRWQLCQEVLCHNRLMTGQCLGVCSGDHQWEW
jgi:hypothetical protein